MALPVALSQEWGSGPGPVGPVHSRMQQAHPFPWREPLYVRGEGGELLPAWVSLVGREVAIP